MGRLFRRGGSGEEDIGGRAGWYGTVGNGYGVSVGSLGMVLLPSCNMLLPVFSCSFRLHTLGSEGVVSILRGALCTLQLYRQFSEGVCLLVTTQTSYTFTYIDCLELQYTRLPPPMFPSGVTVAGFRRLVSLPSATSPPHPYVQSGYEKAVRR